MNPGGNMDPPSISDGLGLASWTHKKHQLENDYNNLTTKYLPENDWMVLKMAKSIATDGWATPVDPQLWTLAVDRRGGVACGTTTGWAEPVVPDSEGY